MSRLLTLPTPFSSSSISLGHLIADPVHTGTVSFDPSSRPDCQRPNIQSKWQGTVNHDRHGRFISPTSLNNSAQNSRIVVNAEQSLYTSLAHPRMIFNTLRHDAAAQTFFHKSALQHQPLYYVTGLHTLKSPTFQHDGSEASRIAEAPAAENRLPIHVRRVDSASAIDYTKPVEDQDDETVFAVELMKVRCRVGPASEPHGVDDIGYEWSYHALDDDGDLQLSIGLGKILGASELRAMAGMADDGELEDERWDEHDEDGLGGF